MSMRQMAQDASNFDLGRSVRPKPSGSIRLGATSKFDAGKRLRSSFTLRTAKFAAADPG